MRLGSRSRSSVLVAALLLATTAAACSRSDDDSSAPPATAAAEATTSAAAGTTATTAAGGSDTTVASTTATSAALDCASAPLQATDVGVTPEDITIQVMADTGSPLAPGVFQGSIDAVKAWGDYINTKGGVGCRKVVVKAWDSKLTPDDTTNGTINACQNSFAMVGTTSIFLLDPSAMAKCKDKAGAPTGLPDLAQFTTEIPHQCNPTTFAINPPPGDCPYTGGVRTGEQFTGQYDFYKTIEPNLHGVFGFAGDLPSLVQSGVVQAAGLEAAGVGNDGVYKGSASDTQAAFARLMQTIKAKKSNIVVNGSNDVFMIKMRKEAIAQGVDSVKIWACGIACYTPNFLEQGGKDVEGTYVYMQNLPFEDAGSNESLDAFLGAIGGPKKATSWGAAAWAAADEFKQVADDIVATDGPNALTRAKFLDKIKTVNDFDDNGFFAPHEQRKYSDCMVVMQVQNGKFVRINPTETGKFDCNPDYLTPVSVDPTVFKG